jgi:hypothetical protein
LRKWSKFFLEAQLLTNEDLMELEARFVKEKRSLRARGIEFDIADIMAVVRKYNQEVNDG